MPVNRPYRLISSAQPLETHPHCLTLIKHPGLVITPNCGDRHPTTITDRAGYHPHQSLTRYYWPPVQEVLSLCGLLLRS
jgi:hypothetical protein